MGPAGWCGTAGHPHRSRSDSSASADTARRAAFDAAADDHLPSATVSVSEHGADRCRSIAEDMLNSGGERPRCEAPALQTAMNEACSSGTRTGELGELLGISADQENMLRVLGRASDATIRSIASNGRSEAAKGEPERAMHVMEAAALAEQLLVNGTPGDIPAHRIPDDDPFTWGALRDRVDALVRSMWDDPAVGQNDHRAVVDAARMLGIAGDSEHEQAAAVESLLHDREAASGTLLMQISGYE